MTFIFNIIGQNYFYVYYSMFNAVYNWRDIKLAKAFLNMICKKNDL